MNYYSFNPIIEGDLVIGVERFAESGEELVALIGEHYQETEATYLSDEYNPNIAQYRAMEEAGMTCIFTVRDKGKLGGYLMFNIYRGLHCQTVHQAREFAFYLAPELRGRKLAPKLLHYAEDCLKQLNCKLVGMSSKVFTGGTDIGPWLEKEGYQPIAVYYVKELEI